MSNETNHNSVLICRHSGAFPLRAQDRTHGPMTWPDIAEKSSYLQHDTVVDNRDQEERSNTSMVMLMFDEVRQNQAKPYMHQYSWLWASLPLLRLPPPHLVDDTKPYR
jgi:hypothetical protein